jgi:hypothetical protein
MRLGSSIQVHPCLEALHPVLVGDLDAVTVAFGRSSAFGHRK